MAAQHRCESLLLGLGQLSKDTHNQDLQDLIEEVGCDVALMKSPPDWKLHEVERVLVPVGGRGTEHELRARFLSSLCRGENREVTFLSVVSSSATESQVNDTRHTIARLAEVKLPTRVKVEVVKSDTPVQAILDVSPSYDLIVLGLGRLPNSNLLENPAMRVAHECSCAAILLSRHNTRLPLPMIFDRKGD